MGLLEAEFEEIKALHKYGIVKARIMNYYETLQQGEVNMPDFMRDDTPEKLADRDLKNLVLNDINKFNDLYEQAYIEIAPLLD